MNILYINHYAGSVHHGMEFRPYYLAQEWGKLGHQVTIVACSYSHIRQTNIDIPPEKYYLEETIDEIQYIWVKAPTYNKNSIWRFINIMVFLHNVNRLRDKLAYEFKPNLVIASSTYPFDTKVSYRIAQLAHAKFIYEVHDLWPLSPIEVGGMSKYHPFIWLTQRAENFGYFHADQVVSLLPHAANYMQQHGMQPNAFIYIPNGIKIDDIKTDANRPTNQITETNQINALSTTQQLPVTHQQLITILKQQYKYLMGYAGGMANGNSLQCAIDAIQQNTLTKHIALVLLGDGINKAALQQYVQDNQIKDVYFLDKVPKPQVWSFLAQMDFLFVGFPKLSLYRFGVSPNKVFDYMYAKKPIIYAISASNDIVGDAHCGISVASDDTNAIYHAMLQLAAMSKDELLQLGLNGYNYVLRYHDYKILAAQFLTACFD